MSNLRVFLGFRSDVREISDSSAMRSCVTWHLAVEISRKVNGLIFKRGIFQDQTTRFSRNVGNRTSIDVARLPQKIGGLEYAKHLSATVTTEFFLRR